MIKIYFVSKKDALYFFCIWGTITLLFLSITLPFSLTVLHVIWGLIGCITIGCLIWVWFGTGYRIENETVKIQTGPLKWTVNIQDIKKVRKKKSMWSAPALAVNRLEIQYGSYDWILVAPKREEEFIRILLNKNSQIDMDEK